MCDTVHNMKGRFEKRSPTSSGLVSPADQDINLLW